MRIQISTPLKIKEFTPINVGYSNEKGCNILNYNYSLYGCDTPKSFMKPLCQYISSQREKKCKIAPTIQSSLCSPNPCEDHYICNSNNSSYSCTPDLTYHPSEGQYCDESFLCEGENIICESNICVDGCHPNPCNEFYLCDANKNTNEVTCTPNPLHTVSYNENCSIFACDSNHTCNLNNLCKKNEGETCTLGSECYSESCYDGFCI